MQSSWKSPSEQKRSTKFEDSILTGFWTVFILYIIFSYFKTYNSPVCKLYSAFIKNPKQTNIEIQDGEILFDASILFQSEMQRGNTSVLAVVFQPIQKSSSVFSHCFC